MHEAPRTAAAGPCQGTGVAQDEHLPGRLVVDRRLRILDARGRLHRTDAAPNRAGWLAPPATPGSLLGCVNAILEQHPCGGTSRCRFCALQQVVGRACEAQDALEGRLVGTALRPGSPPQPRLPRALTHRTILERTCMVRGRLVTRRLLVSARPLHGRDARGGRRLLLSLREAPDDVAVEMPAGGGVVPGEGPPVRA